MHCGATHVLLRHTLPAVQRIPHLPQFAGSSTVFTQAPPQETSGAGQPVHMPATQLWPAAQATPQKPQSVMELCVSAQYSLAPKPHDRKLGPQPLRQTPSAQC